MQKIQENCRLNDKSHADVDNLHSWSSSQQTCRVTSHSDRRQLGTRLEVHSIKEAPTVKKEVFCTLVF